MFKRSFERIATTWLAGLLALLPFLLTLALLAWLVKILNNFIGPQSMVGQLFALIGQPVINHPLLGYLIGWVMLIGAIYPLGVIVQSKLKRHLAYLLDKTVRRIPIIGTLYNTADRFVSLLDQKEDADIGSMSPVWCLFGGDGVAVLALMPNPEPIEIEGRIYQAVLVPTAPVPIGGGLLYIPSEWIRPANIGVDKLTSIYMSMGITPPPSLKKASQSAAQIYPDPR